MNVFIIVMVVLALIILIGFIILVGNVTAAIIIPSQKCPDCHTKMEIITSNVYTGQVLYECPKCHKRVSYHYEENELVKDSDEFTCPFRHKKSEK